MGSGDIWNVLGHWVSSVVALKGKNEAGRQWDTHDSVCLPKVTGRCTRTPFWSVKAQPGANFPQPEAACEEAASCFPTCLLGTCCNGSLAKCSVNALGAGTINKTK